MFWSVSIVDTRMQASSKTRRTSYLSFGATCVGSNKQGVTKKFSRDEKSRYIYLCPGFGRNFKLNMPPALNTYANMLFCSNQQAFKTDILTMAQWIGVSLKQYNPLSYSIPFLMPELEFCLVKVPREWNGKFQLGNVPEEWNGDGDAIWYVWWASKSCLSGYSA